MTNADIIGLVCSYLYAFGLLLIAEQAGKIFNWPQRLTRKIIHIGAGMWVWGILYLFDTWQLGMIPFATFIVLNYIFYRKETFKAMDQETSSPGTVYFAISVTILFLLFWRKNGPHDQAPVAIAAIMAMTWGDALASIFGIRWGRRKISFLKEEKSWLGSFTMLIVSTGVILISLLIVPDSSFSRFSAPVEWTLALKAAMITGLTATVAEAVSPAGTDNLSVPFAAAAALWLILA
jgi:phytol kinase